MEVDSEKSNNNSNRIALEKSKQSSAEVVIPVPFQVQVPTPNPRPESVRPLVDSPSSIIWNIELTTIKNDGALREEFVMLIIWNKLSLEIRQSPFTKGYLNQHRKPPRFKG